MSILPNRSSQLLKYTRLFNHVGVTRLGSNAAAKSSSEIIQREKKVSAFNYDPLSVVITRGEGKKKKNHSSLCSIGSNDCVFALENIDILFVYYIIISYTSRRRVHVGRRREKVLRFLGRIRHSQSRPLSSENHQGDGGPSRPTPSHVQSHISRFIVRTQRILNATLWLR